MRIASVGHVVFAATMIALGILSFISLAGGIGLLWPRAAASAARALFVYLLLWLLSFKARFIVQAPTVEVSYRALPWLAANER